MVISGGGNDGLSMWHGTCPNVQLIMTFPNVRFIALILFSLQACAYEEVKKDLKRYDLNYDHMVN